MSISSLKNRINRIKEKDDRMKISRELYEAIRSKQRYADISDALKNEYCKYQETTREGYEGVAKLLAESEKIEGTYEDHLGVLEFKRKPPTKDELSQAVKEVERLVKEVEAEND